MSKECLEVGDVLVWDNKCRKGIVIYTVSASKMVGIRVTEFDLNTMRIGTSQLVPNEDLIYIKTLSVEEMLTHTDVEVRDAGLRKGGFLKESTNIEIVTYDL